MRRRNEAFMRCVPLISSTRVMTSVFQINASVEVGQDARVVGREEDVVLSLGSYCALSRGPSLTLSRRGSPSARPLRDDARLLLSRARRATATRCPLSAGELVGALVRFAPKHEAGEKVEGLFAAALFWGIRGRGRGEFHVLEGGKIPVSG
jgi:hypothetical protein